MHRLGTETNTQQHFIEFSQLAFVHILIPPYRVRCPAVSLAQSVPFLCVCFKGSRARDFASNCNFVECIRTHARIAFLPAPASSTAVRFHCRKYQTYERRGRTVHVDISFQYMKTNQTINFLSAIIWYWKLNHDIWCAVPAMCVQQHTGALTHKYTTSKVKNEMETKKIILINRSSVCSCVFVSVCLDTRDTRCSTRSFGSIYAVLCTVQHATSAMTATTIMTALEKANTMQADEFVAFHNFFFFLFLFILFYLNCSNDFRSTLGWVCVCVCAVILCDFFLFSLVPTCKSLN